jgi:hypothetical protein
MLNKDVLSFKNVKFNESLVNEIWDFNPRNLEQTHGKTIGMYIISLGQFLVYYQSQINSLRVEIKKIENFIDSYVDKLLTAELLKKHKTKAAAVNEVISFSSEIQQKQDTLSELKLELLQTDGIGDKVSELIATFKRELTRRENELYTERQERRS